MKTEKDTRLNPGWVSVSIVKGVGGLSVYLNEYRISGPKPYGGGEEIHAFCARRVDIAEALKNDYSKEGK